MFAPSEEHRQCEQSKAMRNAADFLCPGHLGRVRKLEFAGYSSRKEGATFERTLETPLK
jgi:hypothetical protein